MGRFKKGLALGSLLGAGLVWLQTTKKGREVRDQILDHAAESYALIKKRVEQSPAWEKMTSGEYRALVAEVVNKYAAESSLSIAVKEGVKKLLGTQLKTLKRELKKRKK